MMRTEFLGANFRVDKKYVLVKPKMYIRLFFVFKVHFPNRHINSTLYKDSSNSVNRIDLFLVLRTITKLSR